MGIDVVSLVKTAIDRFFTVGASMARDATYYRPASFSSGTGLSAAAEMTASVTAFVAPYRPWEVALVNGPPQEEKVLIRASELMAISDPAPGDFLMENMSGLRRDVLSARLDVTGQLWTLQTLRCASEDWGDLAGTTTSEDRGDLAAASAFDDWMNLN